MNLKTCDTCRRLFDSITGSSICPDCQKGSDGSFKSVRHYIRRNPNATIFEVSEACEVELGQLREWIREERIEYTKESKLGIECEKCGKTIRTGRYCEGCKTEVFKNLGSAYQSLGAGQIEGQAKNEKMRFLNKRNK